MEALAKSLHLGSDCLKSLERLNVSERRATAFAWRMNGINEVLNSLTPTLDTINQFKKEKDHPTSIGNFTASIWNQKDKSSPVFNQVQMIGGQISFETFNVNVDGKQIEVKSYDDPINTIIRELGEEAHIYGLVPEMFTKIGLRGYGFDHPNYRNFKSGFKRKARVQKDEEIFLTQAPTFINPESFTKEDRIKNIVLISPDQLETLYDKNKVYLEDIGEWVDLQDSLSTDSSIRKKQNVSSNPYEDERIKKITQYHAYFNEAQLTAKIIDRFIQITSAKGIAGNIPKKWKLLVEEKLTKFGHDLNNPFDRYKLNHFIKEVSHGDYLDSVIELKNFISEAKQYIFSIENHLKIQDVDIEDASDVISDEIIEIAKTLEGPPLRLLKQRIKLIRELKHALQEVDFAENLKFTQNSGPQRAFLVAQNLFRLDTLTPYIYELISQYPDLDLVFQTIFQAFDIDPKKSDWLTVLRTKMKKYRECKTKLAQNNIDGNEFDYYTETKRKLYSYFADQLDISTSDIQKYVDDNQHFAEYLDHPLKDIADSRLRTQLAPYLHDISSNFDELILTAFNIDGDNDRPFTIDERWVAFKAILLVIRGREDEIIEELIESPYAIEVFKGAFKAIAGSDIGQEDVFADEPSLFRYHLKNFDSGNTLLSPNRVVNISGIKPEILANWRRKTKLSLKRKNLERGIISWDSDKTKKYIDRIKVKWNISDFYGRMLIVDTEKFWQDVISKNPFLNLIIEQLDLFQIKKQLTEYWSHEVISYLINEYESYFKEHQFELQRIKRRASFFLEDLRKDNEYYRGEASKVTWVWIKEAHLLKPLPGSPLSKLVSPSTQLDEEVQFFASLYDAWLKKEGDPEHCDRLYDRKRLRKSHGPGLFPLLLVLYYRHRGYSEIIRKHQEHIVYQRKLQTES